MEKSYKTLFRCLSCRIAELPPLKKYFLMLVMHRRFECFASESQDLKEGLCRNEENADSQQGRNNHLSYLSYALTFELRLSGLH